MRLQSEKKVIVRDKMIGGPELLICVPLVAETKADLLDQAADLIAMGADMLEWRVDGYAKAANVDDCLQALDTLRTTIKNVPLIFTCRIDSEGGMQSIPGDIRLKLITEAMQSKMVDIVDVEIANHADFIDQAIETARRFDTRLILSAHHFDATPEESVLYDTLFRARDRGADIAKLAVMAGSSKDVLTLLGATWRARTTGLGIPMVTMAMGSQGVLSRLAGGLYGSDITFAAGNKASAPGQVSLEDMRQAMKVLYEDD